MKKIARLLAYGLLSLALLLILFCGVCYWIVNSQLNTPYKIPEDHLVVSLNAQSLAEGRRLVAMKACGGCHGDNLGGKVWLESPLLGTIVAPNLTRGKGGLPLDYSTSDWLRALRHGVGRDDRPLMIMPATEFSKLNGNDLSAIIAYCSQLEPVDHVLPESKLGAVAYVLAAFDQVPLVPAKEIDHHAPLNMDITPAVSVDFGKYLSAGCEGCHRNDMKGGAPVAPGFPPVADITRAGNVGHWSEQQFIHTLKNGLTPEGKKLNPAEMPWTAFREYTDVELKALYKFLMSL